MCNNYLEMFLFELLCTLPELQHVGKVCNLAINLGTAFGSYMKVRLQTLQPASSRIPPILSLLSIQHRSQTIPSLPFCLTYISSSLTLST
jgi:hypothetical protein